TASQLMARANRLSHGLRALGLKPGDAVATVLPNGIEMIEAYLATFQIGCYLVPINHHLVGPEIAYIVNDSQSRVLIGHEHFADVPKAAAREIPVAPNCRLAVGKIDGFVSYESVKAGQPDTLPADRMAGQVMNYTSGTTGRPKGVRRELRPFDPDIVGQ